MKNIFLSILFSIILFSCSTDIPKLAEPKVNKFKYEVTGTSTSYSVTLENAYGETQQWSDVAPGFFYEWEQEGHRWMYISAQNNKDTGSVTVRIYYNDRMTKENTSYGAYAIATVSGNM